MRRDGVLVHPRRFPAGAGKLPLCVGSVLSELYRHGTAATGILQERGE